MSCLPIQHAARGSKMLRVSNLLGPGHPIKGTSKSGITRSGHAEGIGLFDPPLLTLQIHLTKRETKRETKLPKFTRIYIDENKKDPVGLDALSISLNCIHQNLTRQQLPSYANKLGSRTMAMTPAIQLLWSKIKPFLPH